MNLSFAIFALAFIRAHLAVFASPMSNAGAAECGQHAAPAPRRLRPSRRQLKRRAAGAGSYRIDPGAGIIAQTRGA